MCSGWTILTKYFIWVCKGELDFVKTLCNTQNVTIANKLWRRERTGGCRKRKKIIQFRALLNECGLETDPNVVQWFHHHHHQHQHHIPRTHIPTSWCNFLKRPFLVSCSDFFKVCCYHFILPVIFFI